ncbi:MAG: hypothetical protein K5829_14940 [Treponema sp.]|nr:hypothetical protein [Treponema sp.]
MQLFNRNKKVRKEGSFSESNYSVLDYEQLLMVNGAGGKSGSPSGPTGPSSSQQQNTNSNSNTSYYDNNGNKSNNPNVINGRNMGESTVTPKDILQPIADSSVQNHDKYGKGNTCDEFAANALSKGGYNPSDYYLGNTGESVAKHISDMNKSGKDYSSPTSNANVVFMGDGNNANTRGHEHAGLLFMENDGSVSFYHASSNNPNQYNIKETYPSLNAFEKDFGYDSFYYQGIN